MYNQLNQFIKGRNPSNEIWTDESVHVLRKDLQNVIFVTQIFLSKDILMGILNQFMKETNLSSIIFVMQLFLSTQVWWCILNHFKKRKSATFVMQLFLIIGIWIGIFNPSMKEERPLNVMIVVFLFHRKEIWISILQTLYKFHAMFKFCNI